jgi:hypothetical protein
MNSSDMSLKFMRVSSFSAPVKCPQWLDIPTKMKCTFSEDGQPLRDGQRGWASCWNGKLLAEILGMPPIL